MCDVMKKETLFKIASWGTIVIGIWVIADAFQYFDFYFYLILISGIIGIIGAIISLGIFPLIGGLAISGGMMFLFTQFGFISTLIFSFLKAVLLMIGGCGIILTFEAPESMLAIDLTRLDIGKTEYFELKTVGITNLSDLVEEKGHEEEICSITSISVPQLKAWIHKAEQILEETEKVRKAQLQKDFKKKYRK